MEGEKPLIAALLTQLMPAIERSAARVTTFEREPARLVEAFLTALVVWYILHLLRRMNYTRYGDCLTGTGWASRRK